MARLRDSSRLTLPAYLRLSDSPLHGVGVFAAAPLPPGLLLGPYEGHPEVTGGPAGAGRYSWRVCHGRLVDAGDETHSNWMQFTNCAPDAARRNLAGFQHRGALYFRTVAPVGVGDELLVYYGDDYVRNVDADGYYDYIPPEENLEPKPAAMSDGDDYIPNISIGAEKYCDYSPLKVEPESEFAATDGGCGGGDGDIDYDKEEPESEFVAKNGGGGGEGRGTGDHAEYRELEFVDVYPLKKEPKPELADGGGSDGSDEDEDVGNINVNADHCDPPKRELEPDHPVTGTVTDRDRDVGFECSYCGANLCTQEVKVKHELRCKIQTQRRELESQITEVYHCGYCKCPFVSKEYKEQHEQKWCRKRPVAKRKNSNGTYLECDMCEYVTKIKRNLKSHVLNHNKNNAEWFTCTQCSYKTVHKYALNRHTKIHGNNFICCCPICGKSFRTKQRLDDHLLCHHSDKSEEVSKLITNKIYTCNICNQYKTMSKVNFNEHVAVTHHKGVGCEKYECPHCPYSTFRKPNYQCHLKTHSQQKDHQCTVCKKQFIRKRELDSHVLNYHSDNVDLMKTVTAKIHRCELCSFKTVETTRLKSHVQSKHI